MAPSWTLLLLLTALAASHQHQTHKICVPRTAIEACKKMTGEGKAAGVSMECVEARDRLDCLYKVERHEADFEPVEPEDMYIAGSNIRDSAFAVFKEIRTKEEPNGEHRYEAVSVIHKDLGIKSVSQLKGLKSCHTGVGRNVGYKIPITKLTGMGVLGPLSDASLSPRENELKALSQFFSKACLVGTWSPHPETNQRLKKTYSNLCELCEDPEKCDYPDQNSGYEGALRCLATAGGQVAWTKVIYVKKFFGMAYGSQPAKQSQFNPDDFAYFCPDGSKRPISGGQPCTWAARPWPAFISSTHLQTDEMKQLRDEIAKLNALGESSHADWLAKVLTITNLTLSVDNGPFSPLQYLEKAKYKDVIERDVLKPRRQVRLCTKTQLEMEKCKLLGLSAYSRDIRPSLACVQSDDCLAAVHRKEAELVILDPHQAIAAQAHRLKPILYETYETDATAQEMVAVVPSSSPANAMADLRGRKACLPPNDSAGFFGVLKFLLKTGLIGKNHCPYEKTLTEFFSSVTTSADPLKCLKEGQGEVAFLPLSALYLDGKDLETLCPEGGRSKDWKKCSLTSVPPRLVMTCSELSEVQTDEAMQTLLSAANLYSKSPNLFQLFGRFNSTPNVLFSDHGRGLKAIQDVLPSYEEYKKLVSDLSSCQG